MKTITVNPLSLTSIQNAVSVLDRYVTKLKRLEVELPKALAEFGAVGRKPTITTGLWTFSHPAVGLTRTSE